MPYVLADATSCACRRGRASRSSRSRAPLARRLGEDGTALAARLPVLRPRALRGADPFLLAQERPHLGRRLHPRRRHAAADAEPDPARAPDRARLRARTIDQQRAVELLGVVGAGFGLRTVARELLDLVPFAGWAVKGGVAYAGTKAIGEAAVRYFETRGST